MFKRLLLALFSAAAIALPLCMASGNCTASAQTEKSGQIVMEAYSERVLFEENADGVMPMASTTKILTAIIIIEDCDLKDIVTVPKECVGVEGSSVYLTAGEKISVKDLLYGLMLRSGNDCAETLAFYHSGGIENFARCMNERAKKMGAENSTFKNPHGLPDPEHCTTARDLGRIACHAMRNPVFREIVSAKSVTVPDGGAGYERMLTNKNKMLYRYDGANGIKTGYTRAAGKCLVSGAERNGMQLISVVLNCPDMYERSAELLDEAFASYKYVKIYAAEGKRYTAATQVKNKQCTGMCRDDFYYPVSETEAERIVIRAEIAEPCRLPVYEGDELGILSIYLENQLIFSQKIYSIECVKKSLADIIREIAENYSQNEGLCASTNISPSAALQAGAPATN